MREVRDAAGIVWTVFDVVPSTARRTISQVQPGYAAGWLCFQCATERRRHPGVPPGWAALPDGDLLTLIQQAQAQRLAPLGEL